MEKKCYLSKVQQERKITLIFILKKNFAVPKVEQTKIHSQLKQHIYI